MGFGNTNSSGLGLRAIRIREPRQVRKKATVVDPRMCRGITRDLASSWLFPHRQFTVLTSHLWFLLPGFKRTLVHCQIQDTGASVRVSPVAKGRLGSTGVMERSGYRSRDFLARSCVIKFLLANGGRKPSERLWGRERRRRL